MLHWRKDCVKKYLLIEEDTTLGNQNCFYYTSINCDKIDDDDDDEDDTCMYVCMCVCY